MTDGASMHFHIYRKRGSQLTTVGNGYRDREEADRHAKSLQDAARARRDPIGRLWVDGCRCSALAY